MIPSERSFVTYVGSSAPGADVGDRGRVVSVDTESQVCHVMWSTGSRQHQIDPVYGSDLVSESSDMAESLEDSLDVPKEPAPSAISVLPEVREMAREAFSSLVRQASTSTSIREAFASLGEDGMREMCVQASTLAMHDVLDDEGHNDE